MEENQREIALRIERATATDWLQMCQAAPPEIIQMTGLRVRRFGAAFTVAMPLARQYPINGANGVGILEPATQTLLDDLTSFFRESGCGFGIGVNPVSQPENLAEWLLERGFTKGGHIPILVRGTVNAPEDSTEFRVERIGPEQAAVWEAIFSSMYVAYLAKWQAALVGRKDRFHYLVFDGDAPVAVSQMSAMDGVGFLHFSGVLPEYRGKGIQRALIARRIRDAAEAGCAWVTSTADADTPEQPGYSLRNLLHCGFTVLHHTQGCDLKF